ncbi:MAG: DUF5685 family protein [Clostridia bacterium]|nr:DUF5685 family protein [Clostridia bacterium]
MFGYILPEKPELKIREFEIFRAYYCGVCKSIAKRHGNILRMTLNYDSTFLALLLSSMLDDKVSIKKERCIAHPTKKSFVIRNNDLIDYASDMNVILAYYNLEDNWRDEKSVLSAAAMLLFKTSYKKLHKKYFEKCDIIEKRLQELSKIEREKCSSMDKAAEPFAKLMEEITADKCFCKDSKTEEIMRWIGYNIGKWIYIIDAYDDIEKDIKKKAYNPFIYQYNYLGEDVDSFKSRIKDKVEFNLTQTLSQIARSFELLNIKNNSGILENIIYMGMLKKTEQILKIGSCRKVEKSI